MSDRTQVADAIKNYVLEHLEKNPDASNHDIAKAIESSVDYSFNTIRVSIPLAFELLRLDDPRPGTKAAVDSAVTNVTAEYNDTHYTFTFPKSPTAVLERRVVKDMVWLYSSRGANFAKRAVAQELHERYGEPITENYLAKMLSALGVIKTSPPFPPHLKDKYSPEELDRMRMARIDAEIEVTMSKGMDKKWRKLYESKVAELSDRNAVVRALAQAMNTLPVVPPPVPRRKSTGGVAVCAAYDVHIGKGRNAADVAEGVMAFLNSTDNLVSAIKAQASPARVVAVFGGDFLNIDNIAGQTTSGTPQQNGVEPGPMFRMAVQAACHFIEKLRHVAPVDIIAVPGNHDRMLTYALSVALEMRYESTKDVTVVPVEGDRAYYAFESNLMGFEHGDGPKHSELGMIMAKEQRRAWGNAKHCCWFVGHMHHTHEYDVGGVTVFQVSSLSKSDAWHKKKGYVTSRPAHRAFLFDGDHGHYATFSFSG